MNLHEVAEEIQVTGRTSWRSQRTDTRKECQRVIIKNAQGDRRSRRAAVGGGERNCIVTKVYGRRRTPGTTIMHATDVDVSLKSRLIDDPREKSTGFHIVIQSCT